MNSTNVGDEPPLMTAAEVAALMRVHTRTINRWATAGALPCIRTPGGHRRYREADVLALTGTGTTPAARDVGHGG